MANSDINSVVIVGRLTRDAELRYLNSGTAVASISIAVNRSKKDGDQWISEANFFDVSYFGKGAEGIKPYLTKGTQIAVQGSLRQDRWEKDGQKFSRVNILADSIELLGSRSSSSQNNGNSDSFGGYQQRASYSQNQSSGGGYEPYSEAFGGDNAGFPEDIPF
ncbi:MAG: single-stranded DNA-binding protein [Treponema succinifaciens]|uniref:single-stranded DNA-binding protein n=1 Tax=Treponema succinifaciens TaxID=167 RepID=UPI002357AC64|nr:single-stranded DNA-binding protein [Treponema succinifaciens]MCI6912159.1 single-stranded DNA-binding protein [Treponema succinifaciens]